MDDYSLYVLRSPTLEELVFKRIQALNEKFNGNKLKNYVISFKNIRGKICPIFCLTKEDLNSVLYGLSRLGLIEVIPKHGIRLIK